MDVKTDDSKMTGMDQDEEKRHEMPGLQFESSSKTVFLPGDKVATLIDTPRNPSQASIGHKRPVIRLGTGLTQNKHEITSTKSGLLQSDIKRNKLQILNNQKRYVANTDEMIIGIVQEKHSEDYRLDINGSDCATLGSLSFEGASKKNKPNLNVGSVVYCRVVGGCKNMEPEVTCIEIGSSKSWTGGESLYGELKGGTIIKVCLLLARQMIKKNDNVLKTIGEKVAFQSAVGMNGLVWIQAGDIKNTIAIAQAIKQADYLQADEWISFVNKLFKNCK